MRRLFLVFPVLFLCLAATGCAQVVWAHPSLLAGEDGKAHIQNQQPQQQDQP